MALDLRALHPHSRLQPHSLLKRVKKKERRHKALLRVGAAAVAVRSRRGGSQLHAVHGAWRGSGPLCSL